MATPLCIPGHLVDNIKKSLKNGDIDLPSLYNMNSSEERRAVWEKYVDKDLAKFINTKFERAAASKSKTAVIDFVKSLTTTKEQKKNAKNILTKLAALEDADLLDADSQTATFTDLISSRLGVSVEADEIQKMAEIAGKIETAKQDLIVAENTEGLPLKEKFKKWTDAHIAHKKAIGEMDKYMHGLVPTHNMAVVTGSIFRGNMLLNIPPAMINSASNAVQGVMQALERRIASGTAMGLNTDFAWEYFKMSVKVFHKTGFDISRMYAEDVRLGEHLVHNEGPGITRAIARKQAKVVFKYLLGYSDVVSASAAAADSMNVATAKLAKQKGLAGQEAKDYAQDVFNEAIKIAPDTTSAVYDDAMIAKEQSIADAEYATWTNKGFVSNLSMKLRDWLNEASGDLQIGYWNIPFVKTGANVIQFGIESSPIGGIAAFVNLKSALAAMKDTAEPDINKRMAPMKEVIRLAVRSGLGTLLSAIIVGLIPPDDFFSAYESVTAKQREMLGLKKGVYNAVKIGDKWISLDFFGALGAGFVGMMYAKKYGRGLGDTAFKYTQGLGKQILQVPGIRDFEDLSQSIKEFLAADTAAEAGKGALGAGINSVRSRIVPGILNTFAQAIDPKVRKIDRDNLLDRVIAGVPVWRETLPTKIEQTTGEEIKGEGFWTNMLFGSRVKTANESKLIDEISRLEKKGVAPAISDIDRTSSQVKGLKSQVSESLYQQALTWYGREYGRRATRAIFAAAYYRGTDEEKRDILNKIRGQVRTEMLKRFHYRSQKKRGRK